ncbi:MAG TPA: DUF1549 and DUF1553 domain-containing protein [Planctomycetota bacterium]|nr:DUF1549 and DUF1553 domain-containing protein [Planctomycetota bacterium]
MDLTRHRYRALRAAWVLGALLALSTGLEARPRYRQNLKKHYGDHLAARLDACTTCHVASVPGLAAEPVEKMPPHNPFGARLRVLGAELKAQGKSWTLPARLRAAAGEDSDGDGVPNEVELLAGRAPGDASEVPSGDELVSAVRLARELAGEGARSVWDPFLQVVRPPVPRIRDPLWAANPIDSFIAAEHEARGLVPRPDAPREILLRRVSLGLTGLSPSPQELHAFLDDASEGAYDAVVERLLASPRHAERWARHWMDVWRYSDWAGWGNQVRDSQPHIWRWRDWIVESLAADKGYDRMLIEMLAADEAFPGDRDALRATGSLARSFKLLSREAWMQETVDHAGQAFLGLTLGCARCHDHMYDPISQREYYRLRAVFEPHQVRIDRVPGEPDTAKNGIARVFDGAPDAKTFLFIRGDDRHPDTADPLEPGVPEALGGAGLDVKPVALPLTAAVPEKERFVVEETLSASEKAVRAAWSAFEAATLAALRAERAPPGGGEAARGAARDAALAELGVEAAEARHAALAAVLRVEEIEDGGVRDGEAWKEAALEATWTGRWARLLESRRGRLAAEIEVDRSTLALEEARAAALAGGGDAKARGEAVKKAETELPKAKEKLTAAGTALAKAGDDALLPPSTEYTKRDLKTYPATSTGRRLAFARWLADRRNPLAARVAVNHIWLRHFGQALAPSVADLGLNGRPPTHPALLDWLAAELMEPSEGAARPWSMRHIHRLIVHSRTYRMASTPDLANLAKDPDGIYLWRMPYRRLEAEAVRDNVLHVADRLDGTLGGVELDQKSALETRRRSLYYRHAAEKQVEFLKLFDMAAVTECYERKVSIVPQQALALSNSRLTLEQARGLARKLSRGASSADAFAAAAFEKVLARRATPAEIDAAAEFLEKAAPPAPSTGGAPAPAGAATEPPGPSPDPALRAREALVHALMNHNDFVTVR